MVNEKGGWGSPTFKEISIEKTRICCVLLCNKYLSLAIETLLFKYGFKYTTTKASDLDDFNEAVIIIDTDKKSISTGIYTNDYASDYMDYYDLTYDWAEIKKFIETSSEMKKASEKWGTMPVKTWGTKSVEGSWE